MHMRGYSNLLDSLVLQAMLRCAVLLLTTACSLPSLAAICNGVALSMSRAVTLAPASSSTFKHSRLLIE
jgi:hypothetical protein